MVAFDLTVPILGAPRIDSNLDRPLYLVGVKGIYG
jgi:hypothetical protein